MIPTHPRNRPAGHAGTYTGTVTSLDPAEALAYVEVPRLNPGFEYPARYSADLPSPLTAGDRVAVTFIEGGRDELLIVLRLA